MRTLAVTLILFTMSARAQLYKHLWNDRVLLVFASSMENDDVKSQWQNRMQGLAGYNERDLVVYFILDEQMLTQPAK